MKKTITVNNWYLKKTDAHILAGEKPAASLFQDEPGKKNWFFSKDAMSVHEILLDHKEISGDILRGECASSEYVAKSDWVYRAEFEKPRCGGEERVELCFRGIDTFADIYLNGELLSRHDCFYFPNISDITDKLKEKNSLLVYFHAHSKMIELLKKNTPREWDDYIFDFKLLRKPNQDFHNFSGARPYLSPIGFYGDVELVVYPGIGLRHVDIDTRLSFRFDRASVSFSAELKGTKDAGRAELLYELFDPDGKKIFSDRRPGGDTASGLDIPNPRLWWPRPYGEHPLYRLETTLFVDGEEAERVVKKIGMRKIENIGDFQFLVNGRALRFWGANHLEESGLSHRYNPERGLRVLRLAKDANMNIIRVWGEQAPPGNEFYDFLDENGILIWQDFYICTNSFFPDSAEYREQYRKEVGYMVQTLKHHPAILLWCANNESLMVQRSDVSDGKSYGAVSLTEDIPRLVKKLDPDRFFIPSTPYGAIGQPQDPMHGNIHGYLGVHYEPGVKYPVLYSESCHMCMPPMRSLRRFMTDEEIFPGDYSGAFAYPDNWQDVVKTYNDVRHSPNRNRAWGYSYWRTLPVPKTWNKYLSRFAVCENWDIEKYYDGVDAESLVYKFTAPAVDYLKHSVERVRRGSPAAEIHVPRRCVGYLFWKLNDTWPYLNFTLIDYYQEPVASYYQLKRSYAPVIVSIDAEDDHLYLWGVNDTLADFRGSIRFSVFSKIQNELVHDIEIPVLIFAGRSLVAANLDHLGAIRRECVLSAVLKNENGDVVHRTDDFLDMERNQPFPDAKLTLEKDGDGIIISTDKFARFVELTGDDDGDEFGWDFEDNYFNLFPFESRRITIRGRHKKGVVRAKAHYSPFTAELRL